MILRLMSAAGAIGQWQRASVAESCLNCSCARPCGEQYLAWQSAASLGKPFEEIARNWFAGAGWSSRQKLVGVLAHVAY